MIRNLSIVSLALFAALAVSAQPPAAQPAPERLTDRQLNMLVAAAKTPSDHERIARYYQLKADEYRAQAQVHATMLAGFMANAATNNEKSHFGTVDHCQFMFQSLNQRAKEAQRLAVEQEQLEQAAAAE